MVSNDHPLAVHCHIYNVCTTVVVLHIALALENRPSGRPPLPVDSEKEILRQRVRELEKKLDLAEKTIEVKELLGAYEEFRGGGSKKNR